MERDEWTAAEFFSGIGGMHYACEGLPIRVTQAFDINQIANAVYEHNFGMKPVTVNLEHLPVVYFEKLNVDIWLLSPPCQPYTRGGNLRDHEDERAMGLLHLIAVLKQMSNAPQFLFLENVLNFERSHCRDLLVETLGSRNYCFEEFLVSPLDVGIPNYRLRYYLVAKRLSAPMTCEGSQGIIERMHSSVEVVRPIRDFLRPPADEDFALFRVPEKYITDYREYRHDVVHPEDRRCTTFTKAYGSKYIIGTGSFLQTQRLDLRDYPRDDPQTLLTLRLRFFTPTEVALMHAFPVDVGFSFPTSLSLLNQYRLLGNSLNVCVVHDLFERMLRRL
jgi:tRNA (cytosine38-C5)-methyltransferase